MGVQDRDWFWKDREGSSRVGHAPPAPRHRGQLGRYSPAVLIVTAMGVASLAWVISFSVAQWRAPTAAEHFRRTAPPHKRHSVSRSLMRSTRNATPRRAKRNDRLSFSNGSRHASRQSLNSSVLKMTSAGPLLWHRIERRRLGPSSTAHRRAAAMSVTTSVGRDLTVAEVPRRLRGQSGHSKRETAREAL